MFPPKKKSPDGIVIAVAKEPPRLGAPGQRPTPGKPEPPDDEAGEPPEEEGREEYGAKLMADIEDVGKQYGADASTSREMAADFFAAISKCLRGESEPEHDAGGMDFEGQ